jgi:hypothetical protein
MLQVDIMNEIAELLEKNQALDMEVKRELADVETTLHHGHVMTAALSKHELQANALANSRQAPLAAAAGSQMR